MPLVMPLALLVLGALGWDFAAIGPCGEETPR